MILKTSFSYARKFLMVLASDHITGATGATVTVQLSKGPAPAAFAAAGGAVTEIGLGWYQCLLSTTDTNTPGDLAVHCAGTSPTCDPTDFVDQVQNTVFTDLQLNANGYALIASQVKQNTAFLLPFIMTVNGIPTPGMTGFTAQRNLAGAGFAPCANTVVEDGVGWYHILLAPTDTNATVIEVHITAAVTGADDRNITLYTQP